MGKRTTRRGRAVLLAAGAASSSPQALSPAAGMNGPLAPPVLRAISRPLVLLRRRIESRPAAQHPTRRKVARADERANQRIDAGWAALDAIALPAPRPVSPALPPASGPEERLVRQVAQIQAALGFTVALVGATLAVAGSPLAPWALLVALLLSVGAGAAHTLRHRSGGLALAGLALLGSQLGLLAWAFEVLGARPTLLAVVPALAILALRLTGRFGALAAAAAPLALFAAVSALRTLGIFQPSLALDGDTLALVDTTLVAAGLLVALSAILDLDTTRRRALALAHRQRREAEDAVASYALLRAQITRDTERMGWALANGLRGAEADPVAMLTADPALHDLAEIIDVAVTRLATLQRDREERVRLEGTIRRATRGLEQMAAGRAPLWPQVTGTALDPLVAKLRQLEFAARRFFDSAPRRMPAAQPAPVHFSSFSAQAQRTSGSILPWRGKEPIAADVQGEARPLLWDAWQLANAPTHAE